MAAAYDAMGQGELRSELTNRGLIVYGKVSELRERLRADDARGIFNDFLGNMGKIDLENAYKSLNIPSAGRHEELINKIEKYNLRKSGGQRVAEEAGESLNTGLPTPEDWLGPQTGESILGTPASGIYHRPYTRYLEHYERVNGTTENAFTLRYWRILQNPDVPIRELWPIRIE